MNGMMKLTTFLVLLCIVGLCVGKVCDVYTVYCQASTYCECPPSFYTRMDVDVCQVKGVPYPAEFSIGTSGDWEFTECTLGVNNTIPTHCRTDCISWSVFPKQCASYGDISYMYLLKNYTPSF